MERPFYKRKGVLILAVLVGFLLLFLAVNRKARERMERKFFI